MTLTTTVIEDEGGIEEVRADWDALAVRTSRPFSAPAWILAWWRHVASKRARLRVITMRSDGRLVGLCPLISPGERIPGTILEVAAARFSPPAGVLVEPGFESDVLAQLVEALDVIHPRPAAARLWLAEQEGDLSARAAEAAVGRRAWLHSAATVPHPVVSIAGRDFEEWFATRRGGFRRQSRRLRRQMERSGAEFRLADGGEIAAAIDAFIDLHGRRREARGGSDALVPGLKEMLLEAAEDLLPAGRLRAFTIEVDKKVIAVTIVVAAGDEACGWNSGFDEDWRRYSPSRVLTLHAIADAAERGEARFNLGPGRADYKSQLADREDLMTVATLVGRDAFYPLKRGRLLPYQMRCWLSERISVETKQRLQRFLRR